MSINPLEIKKAYESVDLKTLCIGLIEMVDNNKVSDDTLIKKNLVNFMTTTYFNDRCPTVSSNMLRIYIRHINGQLEIPLQIHSDVTIFTIKNHIATQKHIIISRISLKYENHNLYDNQTFKSLKSVENPYQKDYIIDLILSPIFTPSRSFKVKINIPNYTKQIQELEVNSDTSISQIKTALGLKQDNKLIWAGNIRDNNQTIGSLNITSNTEATLTLL